MNLLKLIALDEDDLRILSAHVQDGVVRGSEIGYQASFKRFALVLNRFNWEKTLDIADGAGLVSYERRMAAVRFERVLKVQFKGLEPGAQDSVLNLLAIEFVPETLPAGAIILSFSGGAAIRLSVECIECELRDLGSAWEAKSKPEHPE